MMINAHGLAIDPRIEQHIVPTLARGKLGIVHGIVVHQTGGSTAAAAFAGYLSRPYGTHFLIDKDGQIYQTASLLYHTAHVGLLKARCLAEHRCTAVEMKTLAKFSPKHRTRWKRRKHRPIAIRATGTALVSSWSVKSIRKRKNMSL